MMTIQEKTQKAVQILVDTLELRSAVKRPLINKERDPKTGEIKTVKYTGDIEELGEWRINIKKFENENIYPDEVNGILATLASRYGFTYYFPALFPSLNKLDPVVVIKKLDNMQWATIIKRLGQYKYEKLNQDKVLYLNNNGDLWREPKNKYCYPMGEDSDRHKIVRYLGTTNAYWQTSSLSQLLSGKDEVLIRREIGKIRENIRDFLDLKNAKVIDGRKSSGYRINLEYKIVHKK